MKNPTMPAIAFKNPTVPGQDRSRIAINPYPAEESRIRLKWIGPDPQKHIMTNSKVNDKNITVISSSELAERFVKNCADILCTMDIQQRFVNVSIASKLILGYEPEEMEGKFLKDFIHPDDLQNSVTATHSVLASGNSFTNLENRYITKDGSIICMSWSVRWSAEDQLIYCVGRDDRDKKAVEHELHKLNESLEMKIRERTGQLEQSVRELEAFSYSVSHDLRAPLRIINGYARLLTGQYKNNADPESIEFLHAIIDSTKYMGRLIDDLLNFSRMEKESVNKIEVDMNYISSHVLHDMQEEDATITKDILIHDLKPAYCDQSLIRQVWVNLLSNAIKYSKKKAKPKIEIGSYEKDDSMVYYIKDNGAGFDMKFAAKLFGVFVRLHNRTEFEGTGVGLALVHRIITKHGGKVWANGKVNEGAVFYFSLPKQIV
jgi:PAS domain S-box-containing protein